jgi:hypothetical protein
MDFDRSDGHPPMLPEWVNQPAEVDSYIWNECVLDMTYKDRMSNDEKYLMDITLQNHKLVYLEDWIHNVVGDVWVSSVRATYDANNWKKPWVVEIDIKANNSDVSFNLTANLSVDSEGFSGTEHTGLDHEGTLYMDELANPLPLPSENGYPQEQIVNGGFEDGTTGWTGATQSSFVAYDGEYSCFLYESEMYQILTVPIPVDDIDSFYFWVYGSGGDATVWVVYSDATSSTHFPISNNGNVWSQYYLPSLASGKTVTEIHFHGGTGAPIYLDDVILVAPSTSPITVKCGVHTFYFFLPNDLSGFYKWNITGDALIVGEDTYDIQTFDRESRISVVIYGDCTIIPEYQIASELFEVTISSMSGADDEQIVNGGFEDGSTGWTLYTETSPNTGQIGGQATIINSGAHTGNSCLSLWSATVYGGQQFSTFQGEGIAGQPISCPVSDITSLSFWYKGNSNNLGLEIHFSDSTYYIPTVSTSGTWHQKIITAANFAPYIGKTITHIYFVNYDNDGGVLGQNSYAYVDDVVITYSNLPNTGTVTINGTPYVLSGSPLTLFLFGNYTISFSPVSGSFNSWTVSGGVSVATIDSPTTMTVSDDGTLLITSS